MRSRLTRFADGLSPWVWPSRERRVRRWLRAGRRWRKKHPPRCYGCGFNLTGLRHLDTCPECGRACEWGAHWTQDGRWSLWLVRLTGAIQMLPMLGWIVAMFLYIDASTKRGGPRASSTILMVTSALFGMLSPPALALLSIWMATDRTRTWANRRRRMAASGVAGFYGALLLAVVFLYFVLLF